MLKVSNIRVPVGTDDSEIIRHVAKKLRVGPEHINGFRLLRKALDVRDKRNLEFVYTAAVHLENEQYWANRDPNVTVFEPREFELPPPGPRPLEHRPVIVGAGPAGLFAAYLLAEQGYRPIVLERGRPVSQRIRDVKAFDDGGPFDVESNYLFGEGGAGTFSDGKLTCRSAGVDTEKALEIFSVSKGKPSILYEAKPHLGSNRLPAVVKSLRRQIIAMGGEVHFTTQMVDLVIRDGRIAGVVTNRETIWSDVVVLAIGHSARDTYRLLLERGISLSPKPFQMGVRIEQPQETVTRAQYGVSPATQHLGPADYTMKVFAGDRDLFTFCMCAGGYIMPSVSQEGYFCTNGMSRSKHESPFANSGLVVTIATDQLPGAAENPLVGINYQEALEKKAYEIGGGVYQSPIQSAYDFLKQRASSGSLTSSYPRGVVGSNLWEWLPTDLCQTLARGLPLMDDRWRGDFLRDATLVAPESRGSCPVRLNRHAETLESVTVENLYPIGEGAGFAGGIVSAAVDGLRAAKAIIQKFSPAR